jgi:hypothetical protein
MDVSCFAVPIRNLELFKNAAFSVNVKKHSVQNQLSTPPTSLPWYVANIQSEHETQTWVFVYFHLCIHARQGAGGICLHFEFCDPAYRSVYSSLGWLKLT